MTNLLLKYKKEIKEALLSSLSDEEKRILEEKYKEYCAQFEEEQQ